MKQDQNDSLQRNLSNRHIQLIAIGGCIGTGLFLGSGSTIQLAGPSIVLIYMLIGIVVFLVMRALGEILLSNLNYKSFVDFVSDLLGPFAGFLLGWSYWLCWIAVGIADLVAISGYTHMFYPNLPSWIPALVCIALFYTLNSLTVKLFGEMEFWFAIIKIIAICVLIIVGGIFIAIAFKVPSGEVTSISNVLNDGNILPNGFRGFLAGFQSATFAFIGVELIGTVAAESKDPYKNLPKAINNIPLRIIMFYVLSVIVIMAVIPWHRIDPSQSPFIVLFKFAGLSAAAAVVYVVVMTSAASSTNSGIFSSSRMLYGLASLNKAPRFFMKLSKSSVPVNGLVFSCACLLSAVILLAVGNKSIIDTFISVTSVATIITLFTWFLIVFSYIRYRQKYPERHQTSLFKMPGGVFSCWVCMIFIVLTIFTLTLQSTTRVGLYLGLAWFVSLGMGYILIPQEVKKRWKTLLDMTINKN
ncbi:L-asparagine transporter or related permease (AnsP) [Commensalibacter communis]|uniref:amino acid permease n=1 Tax=Commensalibacter communis TaxID=2972786 RepID=UPI0022FF7F5F|nr:amino acid permease [Commensalibacter communis]CAI3935757.1 L-asparagine transporter or related permease (AnsP) [Commensalibacter communis]